LPEDLRSPGNACRERAPAHAGGGAEAAQRSYRAEVRVGWPSPGAASRQGGMFQVVHSIRFWHRTGFLAPQRGGTEGDVDADPRALRSSSADVRPG
jgi:hypothetical protein